MGADWKLRGYVIEALLGSGGSADVWRARVAATGEPVALKRIGIGDREKTARARAEAALLSALDHPNLIRLHAAVPSGDALVLVLDLADNGSLRDVLAARGRLTPGETVTALAPVAAALSYLHSESVVHGDVSAANVLFTESGAPLLADVGVARISGDDRDVESTPIYLDPAVAGGGVPAPASDVFMLGALAFHTLTGEPVWQADGGEATIALAARGVPDDLADRLATAGVPGPVAAPVLRALSAQPHSRGSAVEFALDLRHSTTPLAVEFRAGRERVPPQPLDTPDPPGGPTASIGAPAGPPHGARHRRPVGAAPAPVDPGRPSFERPGAVPAAGREPPTRMVQPRPRPTIPRSTRRSIRARAVAAQRRRVLVAAAVALAVVAVAVVIGVRGAASPQAARPRPTPTPQHESSASGDNVAQVLADLDAIRSEAYATGNPALLARVYVPGALLTADAARLRQIVPSGCGLTGALTQYRGARTVRDAHGTTSISVTATLPATRLVCGATVRATAGSTGPRSLRIWLLDTANGPRIAAEQAG